MLFILIPHASWGSVHGKCFVRSYALEDYLFHGLAGGRDIAVLNQ